MSIKINPDRKLNPKPEIIKYRLKVITRILYQIKMPTNNPAYMHEYYLKNKDRLRELLRQKVQCKVCNEIVSHWHLTRHQKSKT